MPRKTKSSPEKGNARTRLLDTARDMIRRKGFDATTVDDLCEAADVTKGAYFHHFKNKEALGVAAAEAWSKQTSAVFAAAEYQSVEQPLEKLLAYVDLRITLIEGGIPDFTCLVGTMAQVVYDQYPTIRDACGDSIAGHAETLERIIAEAILDSGATFTPQSLALHIQASIQGAFVLAKAMNDADRARDSLIHLRHYLEIALKPRRETINV